MARACLVFLFLLPASSALRGQTTGDSLLPEWLPTELPAGRTYAGDATCRQCHAAQTGYVTTAMANALRPATGSVILGTNPRLSFEGGGYRYEIVREGDSSVYTVSDGERSISTPTL